MALLAAAGIVSAPIACGYFPIRWPRRSKRKAAPKGSLPRSLTGQTATKPSAARSSALPCYFGEDFTFVDLLWKQGTHALPSAEISRFSSQLMKSGAKTHVPLILPCFPPMISVPE